jgi:replication fork protection complex subunit Csm3/Swi3
VQASAGGTPDDDELDALLASHTADVASAPRKSPTKRAGPFEVDEPDDDELDALLAQNDPPMPVQSTSNRAGPFEEDPDDDDLDALMAEQQPQPQQSIQASRPGSSGHVDDFADDEEAMRDMW